MLSGAVPAARRSCSRARRATPGCSVPAIPLRLADACRCSRRSRSSSGSLPAVGDAAAGGARGARRRADGRAPRRARWPRDPLRGRHDDVHRRARARRCRDVDLHVPEGELCLVVGRTGSGKSTLLRAVNGLVPHFTGGTLPGRVTVDGRDTRDHTDRASSPTSSASSGRTRWPASSPTSSRTSSPTTMESLGLPPAVMRQRVEETLDLLGLADLRRPAAAHAVRRPAPARRHRLGAHRAPARARARRADLGARPRRGRGRARRAAAAGARPRHHGAARRAPARARRPVRRPGRRGSTARRRAGRVRRPRRRCSPRSAGRAAGGRARPARRLGPAAAVGARRAAQARHRCAAASRAARPPPRRATAARRRRAVRAGPRRRRPLRRQVGAARRRPRPARRRDRRRDGSQRAGKSTLLARSPGMGAPGRAARVRVERRGPAAHARRPRAARAASASCRRSAGDLLLGRDRRAECAAADHDARRSTRATTRAILDGLAPGIDRRQSTRATCPRASDSRSRCPSCWPPTADVLLLDEPTRGLDYPTKAPARSSDPARAGRRRHARSSCRPTTSSSSPRSPTAS